MKPTASQVLRECLELLEPPRAESVPRSRALGKILTKDICADRDYPAADLSMMDGYAIGDEKRESFYVDGDNLPGAGAGKPLSSGAARRIFTGAELPSGATRVLPKEVVEVKEEAIRVTEWPEPLFVRKKAKEARQGDIVLKAGLRLGAIELSILASVGAREVKVFAQPRVAHLVTGDEIVSADEALPEGKLRDSNSDLVAGMLAAHGDFGIAMHDRVSDDRESLFQRVQKMAEACDVILISGGASVSDHDHARPALEAAGFEFVAHRINLRPGAPVGVARRGGQWAFALPGNPLSHVVVLRLLVIPILQAIAGWKNVEPAMFAGILDEGLPRDPIHRDTFWPVMATVRDGQVHLRPGRFQTSGDLIGIVGLNALIHLPTEKPVPAVNDPIYFLPMGPSPI